MILLTQNSTFIIGDVAKILGYIMNAIFTFLDYLSIPKVGLAIVLFTIVIYMLLTPLTYKQQKFSKMSAIMNPELQAVQAKYKGKKDNESMQALNLETKAIYAKYGVSPSGSCLQLAIQMPILFALYRIIYNMPAYVPKMKEAFFPYVDSLISSNGSAAYVTNTENFSVVSQFSKQIDASDAFTNAISTGTFDIEKGTEAYTTVSNTFVDILNRAKGDELTKLSNAFSGLESQYASMVESLHKYNSIFGLDMAHSPSEMIQGFWSAGTYGMILVALLIPILAAVTQWISIKLNPQQANQNVGTEQSSIASSMKTMNYIMPIMSLVFCFTLPSGLGFYWIMGAVVRTIQQIIINKHIDKTDLSELMKKNQEKNEKKNKSKNDRLLKAGVNPNTLSSSARLNTKNISSKMDENKVTSASHVTSTGKGSLAEKAGLVSDYNKRNTKK